MEIGEAQKVLSLIAKIQDSSSPLGLQREHLVASVVPALTGNTLHDASSVSGRVVKWIRGYETKRSLTQKVEKIFWEAVQTETPSELTNERRIQLKAMLRPYFAETGELGAKHRYQEDLEKATGNAENVIREKIKKDSLLNPLRDTAVEDACDNKKLKEVLGFAPRTEIFYNHLKKFLSRLHAEGVTRSASGQRVLFGNDDDDSKPAFNPQRVEERLTLIQGAQKRDSKYENEISAPYKPLSVEERSDLRSKQAAELWTELLRLPEGKSLLVAGSYGHRVKNLKDIFELMKHLPTGLKDVLPPALNNLINNPNLVDPEAYILKEFQNILAGLKRFLPLEQIQALEILFRDDKRALPPKIQELLPKVLAEPLQKQLAKGLFGNLTDIAGVMPSSEVAEVFSFIMRVITETNADHSFLITILSTLIETLPNEQSLSILKWVEANLADLVHKDKQDEAIERLEKVILEHVKAPIHTVFNPLVQGIVETMQRVQYMVPGILLKATSFDRFLASGHVWIEMTRQPNGKFTVLIHGDEYASTMHPQREPGVVAWPLKICDVDQDDIKGEFFDTLLYHHFETSYSHEVDSSVQTLYGCFKALGGKLMPNGNRILSNVGRTQNELIDAMLIEDENPRYETFRMQVDSLVSYCHKYLKDGSLCFDGNPEAAGLAQQAASYLESRMQLFPDMDAAAKRAVEATLQEIRLNFIKPESKGAQDPTLLAAPIAEMLRLCGIEKENFRHYGEVLHLILGDDLMELVDLGLDSVDVLPVKKSEPVKELSPSEKEKINSLRSLVRSSYFQMVFNFAKYGYFIFRAMSSPIYCLYIATPLIQRILPTQVVEMQQEAIALLQSSMTRLFTYALVRLLFSTDAFESIVQARASANDWAKGILRSPELSFELSGKEPAAEGSFVKIESSALKFATGSESDVIFYGVNLDLIKESDLDPRSIVEVLKKWNDDFAKFKGDSDATFLLLEQIKKLPLPSENGEFWKNVKDVDSCMEILSEIGLALKIDFGYTDQNFNSVLTHATIAHFHLMAIMADLAKRSPNSGLEGFEVNGSLISVWSRSNACVLSNPDDVEYLERVVNHFSNSKEQPTEDSLFHFAFNSNEVNREVISPAEANYLMKLYKSDESIQRRISKILGDIANGQMEIIKKISVSFSPDGFESILSRENLSRHSKFEHEVEWEDCKKDNADILAVLNKMAKTNDNKQTVVPRSFRLLKKQASICSSFVIRRKNLLQTFSNKLDYEWSVIPPSFLDSFSPSRLLKLLSPVDIPDELDAPPKVRASTKGHHSISLDPISDYFEKEFSVVDTLASTMGRHKLGTLTEFDGDHYFSSAFLRMESKQATQSQIMADHYNNPDIRGRLMSIFNQDEENSGKLTYTEYTDRIPRIIAYFLEDLTRLSFVKDPFRLDRPPQIILNHLISLVFQGGYLKKQLAASPAFARVLGTFFTKVMQQPGFEGVDTNYIKFGIFVKRYCMRYAPDHCDTFPDFSAYLRGVNYKGSLIALNAAATDEALIDFCVARFADCNHEYLRDFKALLPRLEKRLEDKDFALAVVTKILNAHGVLVDKPITLEYTSASGISVPEYQLHVDFVTGTLKFKKTTRNSTPPHLNELEGDRLRDYQIISDQDAFEIERFHEGKIFVAINSNKFLDKSLEALKKADGFSSDKTLLYWIEKTDQPHKVLLIENSKDHSIIHTVNLVSVAEGCYEVFDAKKGTEPVPTHDKSCVAALGRFCTMDEISCFRLEASTRLHSFSIDKYKLAFKVQEKGGVTLAYETTAFPDYYVAPQQDDVNLRPYGSYLLLLNKKGEKKVLLPTGKEAQAALWNITKHFQPFTHLLPTQFGFGSDKSRYYTYEVDGNGSLVSEDPEAMAHLIQLYIIHQNYKDLERATTLFVDLCERGPVSLAISNQLILMTLIPHNMNKCQKIRMRLTASLEKNRLLHHATAQAQCKETSPGLWQALLSIQAAIIDLSSLTSMELLERDIEGNGALAVSQEWFLYKSLFRNIRAVLHQSEILKKFLTDEERIEAMIEVMVLPGYLAQRYNLLKGHFNIEESIFLKLLKGALVIHNTPGSINLADLSPLGLVRRACDNLLPGQAEKLEEMIKSVSTVFSIEDELVNICGQFRTVYGLSDKEIIKLQELCVTDTELLWNQNSFEVRNFTPESLRIYFLYYYAVARGERSEEEERKLERFLLLVNKRFDPVTNKLIDLLGRAFAFRKTLPSSGQLSKAFAAAKLIPDLTIEEWKICGKQEFRFGIDSEKRIHDTFFELDDVAVVENMYALYAFAYNNPAQFMIFFEERLNRLAQSENQVSKKFAKFLLLVAQDNKLFLPPIEFSRKFLHVKTNPSTCGSADLYSKLFSKWRLLEGVIKAADIGVSTSKVIAQSVLSFEVWSLGLNFISTQATRFIGNVGQRALSIARVALPAASKTLNVLRKAGAPSTIAATTRVDAAASESDIPYREIDETDALYDGVLKSQFDAMFEELPKIDDPKEKPFQPLENKAAGDPLQDDRYVRTNKSIKDFYLRKGKRDRFKLKDASQIFSVYQRLTREVASLEQTLKRDEADLLRLFNKEREIKGLEPIKFDALVQFVLTGNLGVLGKNLKLDMEALKKIDILIVSYLARGSRLKQFQRICANIEAVSQIEPGNEKYDELMERIGDELKTSRCYSFSKVKSPRLVLRLVCFEYFSNKLIWSKQFECIAKLLLETPGDQVLELIMSFGKTVFGIPVMDDYEADGTKIVINIWPSGMADTNIRQISKQHRELFQRAINVIRFDRDHSMASKHLQAIKVALSSALENRETVHMTREDLQALELSLIDTQYRIRHGKSKSSTDLNRVLVDLKDILLFIRVNGKVIGDEAHELFYHPHELNYPVGASKSIEQKYYFIMQKCMEFLFADKAVLDAIRENRRVDFTPEMKTRLAQCFIRDHESQSFTQVTDFESFVTGKSKVVPESISQHPEYAKISLIKGMITVLLPNAMSKESFVDHGPSDLGKDEFARPYMGNTRPMENALIRSPYESLTKTFMQFINTGLKPEQINSSLSLLKTLAEREAKESHIHFDETPSNLFFKSVCPNQSLEDKDTWPACEEALKHSQKFIYFYIENFVYEEIRYWQKNICSNTQNFGSIAATQYHLTGTPYNDGTYPAGMNVLQDEGTTGDALHIASNKCPEDGVKILSSSAPGKILDEVLHKYFTEGSNFTALIDGSALLKGMSDTKVSEAMMEYVKENRKDIKGIVFFKKDKDNRDQLVCWEVGAKDPVPLDKSTVPVEARLTYFDHLHGFAADVPQKSNGKAVNLVGDRVTLYRLLQEIFRMRGIKVWKKLIQDTAKTDNQTQEVHFAMTAETAKKINANGAPTFRDIVTFAVANEANVGEDNYYAMINKIKNIGRRYVLDAILNARTADEMNDLFIEYEDILVTTIEDDPAKLWGMISVPQDTSEVLKEIKGRIKTRFEGVEQVSQQVDALKSPVMVPQVQIYTDGVNTRFDAHSDVGQIVTVTANQNQDQDQDQQQQQQQQQQQNVLVSAPKRYIPFYEEIKWERTLSPYTDNWISDGKNFPQIWNAQTLANNSPFNEIANAINPKIWVTNNFLPHNNPRKGDATPITLGSVEQRPLTHLLVMADKVGTKLNVTSVGCLTLSDAAYWRDRLNQEKQPENKRAFIYDVPLGTVTWGGKEVSALKEDETFRSIEVQLKFLNGDFTNYNDQQKKDLRKWVATTNTHALRRTAETIYMERKGRGSIRNTVLDLTIKDSEREDF